jgi:cell division protein FtsW
MFMQRNVAYLLLISMLALIALGLVMLTSTSSVLAPLGNMTEVYSNLRKQCVWLALGGAVCGFLSLYDYQKLMRVAPVLIGVASVLLALCLVPHIGVRVNGSPRWLRLEGWTYQPSELAKLALILFLAWWLGKKQKPAEEFVQGFVWPVAAVLPILVLMIAQKDLGTTAIMLGILVAMLFCAGVRTIYLLPAGLAGLGSILVVSLFTPERMGRWLAWIHPHVDHAVVSGKEWQQLQALIALGSGGMWGLGLGNSRQVMYWLPEASTDFVFPIIGEELGMWVALGVVLAFLIMTLCGGWITLHAPDTSGVLLGTGVTLMIALQAMMNLAVVTSLMPCKGIPLPFISYGGSNLLTCLAGVGLLFNIHRQGIYQAPRKPALGVTKAYSVRM